MKHTFSIFVCSVLMNTAAFAQTPYETLVAYRAQYPVPMETAAQVGELLNRVAWDFRDQGMVLLGKKGGANCPMPNGVLISCDYLVHRATQTGHDVFVDAGPGGITKPVRFEWGPGKEDLAGAIANGSRSIVEPVLPDSTNDPGQPPPPVIVPPVQPNPGTGVPNLGTIEARLAIIEQVAAQIRQQNLDYHTETMVMLAQIREDGVSVRDTFTFISKYILPTLSGVIATWQLRGNGN